LINKRGGNFPPLFVLTWVDIAVENGSKLKGSKVT